MIGIKTDSADNSVNPCHAYSAKLTNSGLPPDDHLTTAGGHHDSSLASARPAHPNRGRRRREPKHLHRAVLRPISRPRLDLAHRAHSLRRAARAAIDDAELPHHAVGVP